MALPIRETFSPITRIHDEIDHLLQDYAMPGFWPRRDAAVRVPSLDLSERDGNLIVEAELPGIEKSDVRISYSEQMVTIQAESRQKKEEKREGFYRSERKSGSFYRAIPLPVPVEFEKAHATFKNGVLTLTLPKAYVAPEVAHTIPVSE